MSAILLADAGGAVLAGLPLIAVLAFGIVILFAMLIPSFVAYKRGHPNLAPIVAVNLLLGFTFIGWVVALVWSLTAFDPALARNGLAKRRRYRPAGDSDFNFE